MTDIQYQCSTCKNVLKREVFEPGLYYTYTCKILGHLNHEHYYCMYHPGAREYLMAPAIKELERKRDRMAEFIYDSSTNPMVAAYDEAISLIRGAK